MDRRDTFHDQWHFDTFNVTWRDFVRLFPLPRPTGNDRSESSPNAGSRARRIIDNYVEVGRRA
jgi:hypothetical protein